MSDSSNPNEVPKLEEKPFEICQKLTRVLEIPYNIQRLARSDLLLENQEDQIEVVQEGHAVPQVFSCSGQEVKSHLYVMGHILLDTQPPSTEILKVKGQIREKLSTIADLVVQAHLNANFILGQLSKLIKILESELNRYPGLVSCLQYFEIPATSTLENPPKLSPFGTTLWKNTKITYFLTKLLLQTEELVQMIDPKKFQDFQQPLVEIITINKLSWSSKIQIFTEVSSQLHRSCQKTANLVEKSSNLLKNGAIKEDLEDLVKNLKQIRRFGFRGSSCSAKLKQELNKLNFFIRELHWIFKVGLKFDQFVLKTLNSILGITLSGSSWTVNISKNDEINDKNKDIDEGYLGQNYKNWFKLEEKPKYWFLRLFRRMARSLRKSSSDEDLIVQFLKDAGSFQEIFDLQNFGKFVEIHVDLPLITLSSIYQDILRDMGRLSLYYTSSESESSENSETSSTSVEEILKNNTISESFFESQSKKSKRPNILEISTIFEKPRRKLTVESPEPQPEPVKIISLEKLFERYSQISSKSQENESKFEENESKSFDYDENDVIVDTKSSTSTSINTVISEIVNKIEINNIIENNSILELG